MEEDYIEEKPKRGGKLFYGFLFASLLAYGYGIVYVYNNDLNGNKKQEELRELKTERSQLINNLNSLNSRKTLNNNINKLKDIDSTINNLEYKIKDAEEKMWKSWFYYLN